MTLMDAYIDLLIELVFFGFKVSAVVVAILFVASCYVYAKHILLFVSGIVKKAKKNKTAKE